MMTVVFRLHMRLYKSDIIYGMTLIATAYNDENIVIGADSLTTVHAAGSKQPDTFSEKIFLINESTALGLSGYYYATSREFIVKFCRKNKREKDLASLQKKLIQNILKNHTLYIDERLQFTMAGYVNNKPRIDFFEINTRVKPSPGTSDKNYLAKGYDGPCNLAYNLFVEKGVLTKPETKELKVIVETTIRTCINEFKDSVHERLGGDLLVKVLQKPRKKTLFTWRRR